ncbi:MAG TPA: DUF4157 domain-containing protein [Kofleriaceae bacterium]|nr:DUF4157 domain-containing protein [Kofleriaceae bacterium]
MSFAKRDATRTASNVNTTTSSTVGKRTLTDHLQPHMRVGPSGDHHECEADAVAHHVQGALHGAHDLPSKPVSVSRVAPASSEVQGSNAIAGLAPASVEDATSRGGGSPLDANTASRMTNAFGGHDFSGVRVHTDAAAAQSATDIGAEAYTVGQSVYFSGGAYQPGTPGGDGLIAHELTHTLQQGPGAAAQRRLIQRQDTGGSQPTEQQTEQTDAEGNHYHTASGKTYLSSAPVIAVPGHSGKYEALPANPKATYDSLRAQVLAVKQTQLTTANQLSGGVVPPRDYNYWFAKVYYFVTQHELDAIDNARYQYPLMKLQEVIWFQNAYAANLAAWQSGQRANCEPHWRQAFDNAQRMQSAQVDATTQAIGTGVGAGGGALGGAAAGAAMGAGLGAWFFGVGAIPGAIVGAIGGALGGAIGGGYDGNQLALPLSTEARKVLAALLPAIEAHIRFDLPRALAGCYNTYYAGIPGLGFTDFQTDFDTMGPIFDAARDSLNPEIQAATGLSDTAMAAAMTAFPSFFDTAQERRGTWMKAQEIVASVQAGQNNAQTDQRVRALAGTGAPISADSSFAVDNQPITGFDWQHNPGTPPPQTVTPATGGTGGP